MVPELRSSHAPFWAASSLTAIKALNSVTSATHPGLIGCEVVDENHAAVGTLHKLWTSRNSGRLDFLGVKTGWLFGHNHVVPAHDALIDDLTRIQVPYGLDLIKEAPVVSAAEEITAEQEAAVCRHYGIRRGYTDLDQWQRAANEGGRGVLPAPVPDRGQAREKIMPLDPRSLASDEPRADQPAQVLTLNVGSSSIRLAFFAAGQPPVRGGSARVERIGLPGTILRFKTAAGTPRSESFVSGGQAAVTRSLIDWLEAQPEFGAVAAVAHRLVHGGPNFREPQRITPALLEELERLSPMDPDHLPAEIGLIRALQQRRPLLPQVACFDTAFHAGMPRVARLLPIPRSATDSTGFPTRSCWGNCAGWTPPRPKAG